MWLLNTSSIQLEFFSSSEEQPYAILSHTWGEGEVSFQDIRSLERAKTMKGYSKIEQTCQLALQQGLGYAWVDTCCIDKQSSAELTEAINSMFKWYADSAVCFVILSDFPASGFPIGAIDTLNGFQQCRWFGRGWTLQELIAPKIVKFYDQSWAYRGDKNSLEQQLFDATRIDIEVLRYHEQLTAVPIVKRMSWASERKTTRVEDLAYCLFGIFDVNLPLIYGEGPKAFTRLQEAIGQENADPSLFAWISEAQDQEFRGCFARSPSEFRQCGNFRRILDPNLPVTDFELTNHGMKFKTVLTPPNKDSKSYLLNLKCHTGISDEMIVVHLIPTVDGYARCDSSSLFTAPPSKMMLQRLPTSKFYIPKMISPKESQLLKESLSHTLKFRIRNATGWQIEEMRCFPKPIWDSLSGYFITGAQDGFTGRINLRLATTAGLPNSIPNSEKIIIGFDILVGLFAKDRNALGEVRTLQKVVLEPWAAIYPAASTINFHGVASQIRAGVALPTSSRLKKSDIIWREEESYHDGWWTKYSSEHSMLLSLSTNVMPGKESSMYEVVLDIKEEEN